MSSNRKFLIVPVMLPLLLALGACTQTVPLHERLLGEPGMYVIGGKYNGLDIWKELGLSNYDLNGLRTGTVRSEAIEIEIVE